MSSNRGQVDLGVHGTYLLSCTWTKIYKYILKDIFSIVEWY